MNLVIFMKIGPFSIGMRTVKTALAVVLGLYLSYILDLRAPIFTSIASITTMQPSFSDTSKAVKRRLFTCIFGVIFGYVLSKVTTNPYLMPVFAGLGVVVTIVLHQATGLSDMTTLAVIVFVASFATKSDHMTYGINRLIGTCLGVAISVAVNVLISSPKIHENFYHSVTKAYDEIVDLTRACILLPYPTDLSQLEKDIDQVNKYYHLLDEELNSPFYSGKDFKVPHAIIDLINEIYLRFQLLEELKPFLPTISEENKKIIEDLFSYTVIFQGALRKEEAAVYNYHIHTILRDVSRIKDFIQKDRKSMR